ncbi:BolA family transcriptional regulator [Oxalicibacterium flavum]|uniref:BolA family transcriptional regulator n=1 Tax=Oxalicibacterium flavum TaxID=179467 RepID=A0A8J2XYQ8_9BURK|nr:BolA family protein [Oxalicibacterium flavum]GGC00747.1 BolA family transcriptional regulator [Oxalicibacterium flavum]
MTDRIERIRSRLLETFSPQVCQLEDESALHAGHAGAASGGGHFRLTIVAAKFENQSRVNRHRLVYDCLDDMMKKDIHALAITALAPSEV